MLKNAMQLIMILYQIVKGALQKMSKWSDHEDRRLSAIIESNKEEGKTMKEAFKRASVILGRTPSACEARWYNITKGKVGFTIYQKEKTPKKIESISPSFEPEIEHLISEQLNLFSSGQSKANLPIDYSLLQTLLDKQEVENRKKEIEKLEKEKMLILKEELKKIIDSLDEGMTISNKDLLVVGKYLIDIWFKQQLGK